MRKAIRRYFLRKWLRQRYETLTQQLRNVEHWNAEYNNEASNRAVNQYKAMKNQLDSIMESGG